MARHDQNPRFSKSLCRLKNFYTRLTPAISRLLTVTNLLKTGQALLEQTGTVLEWASLILDLLAVLRFDHACLWLQEAAVFQQYV